MSLSADARNWRSWASLTARLILGVVLIWAGVAKVGNLPKSVTATTAYQMLPYEANVIIGNALPFCEIALGLALVIGLFTRVMGVLGALMMLAFVIAITSVWARGISIDCGCFGSGGPISREEAVRKYPWEILRDVGLLACGVWLAIAKQTFIAVDAWLFRPVEEMLARKQR